MKKIINKLIGDLLLRIIPNNKSVFNFSSLLINRYTNNRNFIPKRNGEYNLIKYFINMNSDEKIFFDIGCNVGEFGEFLIDNKFKGQIYMFDALDNINKKLLNNNNIIFNKILFWNKSEKIKFYIDKNNPAAGTNSPFDMLNLGYNTETNHEEFISQTLDNFILSNDIKKIDYLKIDVEGSEFKILQGLKDSLNKNKIKYIHLEYGHAAMADRVYVRDFVNYLTNFGMEMYVIIPNGLRKVAYKPHFENYYDYINFFF